MRGETQDFMLGIHYCFPSITRSRILGQILVNALSGSRILLETPCKRADGRVDMAKLIHAILLFLWQTHSVLSL
jgi:hypothetical protein